MRIQTIIGVFLVMVFSSNHYANAQSYIEQLEDIWVQPVDGKITDTFGTRNGNHKGIDIAAPEGEKIVSVSEGVVTKSYYSSTYGHVVFVEHPEGYETVYAHLSKRLVNEGDHVNRGQSLGIIGNTGISTGTHLHFELHKGEWTYEKENALDPLFVFSETSTTAIKNDQPSVHASSTGEEDSKNIGSNNKPNGDLHKETKKLIKVEKGDTLWGLAHNFQTTVTSLKNWNSLTSDVIHPGQELTIYLSKENSYVVQAGDTIESIAEEFRVNPNHIKETNHLTDEIIYPQQVLVISKN